MRYKTFIGIVMIFQNTENHFTLEPFMCAAKDEKEAKEKTEKYAQNFIEKHRLNYRNFLVTIHEQKENRIRRILHFARTGYLRDKPKRPKMIRGKIELKLNDGVIYI